PGGDPSVFGPRLRFGHRQPGNDLDTELLSRPGCDLHLFVETESPADIRHVHRRLATHRWRRSASPGPAGGDPRSELVGAIRSLCTLEPARSHPPGLSDHRTSKRATGPPRGAAPCLS